MATAKKKKEVEQETPVAENTVCMYVGPTVHKIGVIQNTVYTDIPESAKEAIKTLPIIGGLFIDIKDYPEAETQIRQREGYIWSAYKAALTLNN